ncbi:hypothetical protein AX17_002841 [Amanita inopinata Kibby_2008]|nr:hypothetical protein AX17_002841 [Amanita inopinata Kibby_2008]
MPPKRKTLASSSSRGSNGLAPGERLKRTTLPDNKTSAWGWVGTEVQDSSSIATEHLLATCGFSKRNANPFCLNRFAQAPATDDRMENDVIMITDHEPSLCSKKGCKHNPNCLNYLGQDKWEDDAKAEDLFMQAADLLNDPAQESRVSDIPVGLKNLGATCYANASLQVWFRDLVFRAGVYSCQPSEGSMKTFKDSPIFHLQVTFAAMQEGSQGVHNPSKLIESLALRTSEQQDAQEFEKLFMSHLDVEFQRQGVPSLRSLITDQFQGKQVHGTICKVCQYQSERETGFLELEINLKGNATLEDGIKDLLQSESLSGENRYCCSHCNGLQDATRYTKLRNLPPILHFSLMRFVYDLSSMERRKSKQIISFPTTLDMSCYLDGHEKASMKDNVYELRGVLLHKGSSAYHGHYEAQVYDETFQSWFQFNDELVTKIKTLGDRVPTRGGNDPGHEGIPDTCIPPADLNVSSIIRSKDAYMLMYARRPPPNLESGSQTTVKQVRHAVPRPPPWALEIIESVNAAHVQACHAFSQEKLLMMRGFQDVRRKLQSIYRTWNLESYDEVSAVVSQQALTTWLLEHCVTLACQKVGLQFAKQGEDQQSADDRTTDVREIKNDDIECVHGWLDPGKASEMKRITKRAYLEIRNLTNCIFAPFFQLEDVCRVCVDMQFQERLYQIEHPQLVVEFDRAAVLREGSRSCWISKRWLRDWRLTKPRMHVLYQSDPDPESGEFRQHVRCEHELLSVNVSSRCRISMEGANVLKKLYPAWNPPSVDEALCDVCDALFHAHKEDRRETRKRAEEEKAQLPNLYDSTFDSYHGAVTGSCAVISAEFVKSWKRWLTFPSDCSRPEMIDNTNFLCEHDMLVFDPNTIVDLDSSMFLISLKDWETLESYYTGGPLISLTKIIQEDATFRFDHEIPTCQECRLKRKTNWEKAEITIQLYDPHKQADARHGAHEINLSSRKAVRQSKRLRQRKQNGERRRITVSKSTTIKEIKVQIQDDWGISTICQRLFYQGAELLDSASTVESLGIVANDVLELREVNEVHDLDSDAEDVLNNTEGEGFSGTLLSGSLDSQQLTPASSYKACPTCTFHNPVHVLACTICDTPLQET